jgi:hypothetical protein
MPETSGYLAAKTDASGVTRYWALALMHTESGSSIQFYYRPKGSTQGHRLTVANIGMFTEATMDPEFVISGDLAEAEADINPESGGAQTTKSDTDISAKGAMNMFSQMEAVDVDVVPEKEEVRPGRRRSVKLMNAMSALGGGDDASPSTGEGAAAAIVRLERELADLAAREKELEAVIAVNGTYKETVKEAERVAQENAVELRKLQSTVKSAEVRAVRAAAKRDEAQADSRDVIRGKQSEMLAEVLGQKSGAVSRATHLSMTPGVTQVPSTLTAPSAESIPASEMLAVLSMFADLK